MRRLPRLAYVEDGRARLVSRHGNTFKSFPELTAAIGPALGVADAVLVRSCISAATASPRSTRSCAAARPRHFLDHRLDAADDGVVLARGDRANQPSA